MLFNSFQFLVFFPVVTLGYFLLPNDRRWLWLLAASCYFYAVLIPAYLLVLFVLILNDYFSALKIETSQGRARLLWLLLSLSGNIGMLVFFKYRVFVDTNLADLAAFLHWNYSRTVLALALPVGLSFHTFQSIAYTVEVYRGRVPAEKHLGIFALYVMFYPQLVAGPIERPQNMLHQFREDHVFDYARVTDGLKLMCWGFFKKMVVADRLASHVNRVYADPTRYNGLGLSVATIFFAFQIYCDFSGYSDIAVGAAQVMGFRLTRNFKQPYYATSIGEFWRRWHISLSTWFRDFVYVPMGGSRVSTPRWQFNVMVTFLLSGLWHGASWTFVVWGGLHGLYLLLSTGLAKIRGALRLPAAARTLAVFAATSFAWIFFRAETVQKAAYVATHLFAGYRPLLSSRASFLLAIRRNLPLRNELIVIVAALVVLMAVERVQTRQSVRRLLLAQPAWLRWSLYYGAILAVLTFGVFDQSQFIYFQF